MVEDINLLPTTLMPCLGPSFVPNHWPCRTCLWSVGQLSSLLKEEQQGEAAGISRDVAGASAAELRHSFQRSH